MSTAGKKKFGPDVLATVIKFIEQNIHRCLTLDDVAGAAGYSKFQFHRDFKAATGVTVKRAIVARQIEVAKENMLAGMTLEKVAHASGSARYTDFSERFRKVVGMTPAEWLKAESTRRGAATVISLPPDWPEWCGARMLAARWGVNNASVIRFHHIDGLGKIVAGQLMVHRDEVDAAERRAAAFKKFRYVRAKKWTHRGKPRKE